MKFQTALRGAVAPFALSVALAAHPVMAQDDSDDPSAEDVLITDAEDEPVASDDTVIFVTGSRIRRDEFTSTSPLTVVDPEIASRQGLNSTASMVQGSPIAAGSDQITAALSSAYLTNGGTGAETVSLRGLGAERTLVLLNGRRAGPSGTRGGVSSFDLNVLPQSIVGQVDILKDGASSIYGSDAVAGVVNLITKRDTDGIEFDLFGSAPFKQGGEQWSATATWGKTFDRGHILISGSYSRRNELARGDRDYLGCGQSYVFTDESYSTRADLIDPRTNDYACSPSGDDANTWGHVWTYDYSYNDASPSADGGVDIDDLANIGNPNGSNVPGSDGDGTAQLIQYSYGNDNLGAYIPGIVRNDFGQIGVPDGWYPVAYDAASTAVENNYHPFMDYDTVSPEANSYTAYLDGSYELADGIEFYTELLFNKRDNFVNASGQVYQFGLGETYDYYYDYDLVPALDDEGNQLYLLDANGERVLDDDGNDVPLFQGNGLQFPGTILPDNTETYDFIGGFDFDPYAAGWVGPAVFSPTAFDPFVDSSVDVKYYRAVAGFRGDVTSSWSYDVYGQYSRSVGTYRNQTALKDALECANFRSGRKGYSAGNCPGGVSPISGRQNVIVDWFSPRVMNGQFTQDEYDFLFAWDEGKTTYTQKYVEGIVTGDLFTLPWSDTIGLAVGATIREDVINDVPGEIRQADNGFNFGGAGITAGKSVTKEAFGEIDIPLLEDLPFIQRLDFTGAARVTNVSATRASDGANDSDNGNLTYKLGLDWAVNDWVRLRGTYGTSYRAPALFEQFLADQTGYLAQRNIDPCIQYTLPAKEVPQNIQDACAADGVPGTHTGQGVTVASVAGGGLGLLEPETSKAWTASMVLTPQLSFLPNTDVSIAIDYFDIEVNGEIAQLGGAGIISSCYSSDFFPEDPLCGEFYRFSDFDNGNAPQEIIDQYDQPGGDRSNIAVVFDKFFNINSQKNRGVDVTTRIIHDFAGDTTLTLQGQMTWQLKDTVALFDGFSENNNGEAGDPKWIGDFYASIDTGPWTFFYGLDVVGKTNDEEDFIQAEGSLCPTYVALGTVCAKLRTSAQFYHSFSVTREIGENYQFTLGMANITNNTPPRVSQLGGNGVRTAGQGVFYSQYDLLGRRVFANLKVRY